MSATCFSPFGIRTTLFWKIFSYNCWHSFNVIKSLRHVFLFSFTYCFNTCMYLHSLLVYLSSCYWFAIQQTLQKIYLYCDLDHTAHSFEPCGQSPSQSCIAVSSVEKHLSPTLLIPHYPRASTT